VKKIVAIGCLVVSGFAGLVYEVCWIRQASLAFGSTTFALSSVLAIFFAGLAIGSFLFGRVAQRTQRPLFLYAGVEILLALFALASPVAFHCVDSLYGPVYRTLSGAALPLFTVRILLLTLVLLPPTVLMGGSLPLFCRQFVTRRDRIAGTVGFLYGANTLGAAAGCAVTGLVLLPQLGVSTAIYLAAVLNILVGVIASLLGLRAAQLPDHQERTGSPTSSRKSHLARRQRRLVAGLFCLTGLVALGLEVVWTRFLALLVRNSVYTYTITLTVVLVGIVLGSLLASRLFDRRLPRAVSFGALQVLTGLSVLTLMLLPVAFWRGLGAGWIPVLVLMLAPAVFSGAALPLANRMVLDDPLLSAASVGRMVALNTLGGIVGALLIGFIGLPAWGLDASLKILTGLALAGGFAAWLWLDSNVPRRLRYGLVAASALVWFAIPLLSGSRLPADFLAPREKLVDYREGYTASLAVVRSKGALQLEIDRLWQGKDVKNHQIMAAHVPMLAHSSPFEVLVVGVGTGQTASRFLMYDITRLDCVDIEPVIFPFIREYFDADWMRDGRVTTIGDDGRTYLAHSRSKYDLISLEVGQVFRPGVAAFYTTEFYTQAAARLNSGGMLSQFVPLSFFGLAEFRSVVRTFLDTFPLSFLWYNSAELLLIGLKSEHFRLDLDRIHLVAENPVLYGDLQYSQWGGPEHWLNQPTNFLAGFLCGPRELSLLAADAPAYSDDRPTLAYATSRVKAGQRLEVESVQWLRRHLTPVSTLLDGDLTESEATAVAEMRERNLRDIVATAYLRTVEELQATMTPGRAIESLEVALQWNRDNAVSNRMMGDALTLVRRFPQAEQYYTTALRLRDDDPLARRGLGLVLLQIGRADAAIPHLERVVHRLPDDPAAHNYLGAALAQQGRLAEAIHHFEVSVRLRPGDESVRQNLERAREELQRIQRR
jgi:spermidine synthase